MSGNNVIDFPKPDDPELGRLPTSMDEAVDRIEAVRQYYIDELTASLMEMLAQQLQCGGFPVLDDPYKKDFAFLIEAVRNLMCSASGLYHPFQDVSDQVMVERDGVLEIGDEVCVSFKEDAGELVKDPT